MHNKEKLPVFNKRFIIIISLLALIIAISAFAYYKIDQFLKLEEAKKVSIQLLDEYNYRITKYPVSLSINRNYGTNPESKNGKAHCAIKFDALLNQDKIDLTTTQSACDESLVNSKIHFENGQTKAVLANGNEQTEIPKDKYQNEIINHKEIIKLLDTFKDIQKDFDKPEEVLFDGEDYYSVGYQALGSIDFIRKRVHKEKYCFEERDYSKKSPAECDKSFEFYSIARGSDKYSGSLILIANKQEGNLLVILE